MSAATLFAQDSLVQADTPRTTTTAQGSAALTASASQKIFLALKSSDLDSFKTLLAAGADPNARDPKSGRTLLMIADKAAAVKLLLAYGADPTLQDRLGATALHHTVTLSKALEIIPLLIAKGADINAKAPGWSQETPFMAAKQLFYQHRVVFGTKVMQLLANNGADINAIDEKGNTVLISAVVSDKPELVRLMIEMGADLSIEAHDGLTAMAWALELGFVDIIELLEAAQP